MDNPDVTLPICEVDMQNTAGELLVRVLACRRQKEADERRLVEEWTEGLGLSLPYAKHEIYEDLFGAIVLWFETPLTMKPVQFARWNKARGWEKHADKWGTETVTSSANATAYCRVDEGKVMFQALYLLNSDHSEE